MSLVGKPVARYATAGAVSGLAFKMLHMGKAPSGVVDVRGYDLPLWAVGAGLGVGSVVVVDAIHAWLLPHISKDKSLQTAETAVLHAVGGGAGFVLGAELLAPGIVSEGGWMSFAGQGAVVSVLSQYVIERIEEPLLFDDTEF